MRVFCVGDSLGLPREGVLYEDTWYYRLKRHFPEIELLAFFKRSLLITEAVDNYYDSYFTFYRPDIVIIQTGICDCAPRTFNSQSRAGRILLKFAKLLGLTDCFWKIIKKRDRKSNIVYTDLPVFKDYFNKLINKFLKDGVKKIIVIEIGHSAPSVIRKSKFFNDNVDKYNHVIESVCKEHPQLIHIIHPLDKVQEDYFVDGYHCNAKGMDVVYHELLIKMEDYLSNH